MATRNRILAEIQRLPYKREFAIRKGVKIALSDRVYIEVPEEDKDSTEPFRMGLVLQIKGSKKKAWIKIQFYKTTDDLPSDNLLAPTELEIGTDVHWVLSTKILDPMADFFRVFDDSKPDPPRMNSKIWFHRSEKSRCMPCGKVYLPHLDRQRYCIQCEKWIHVGCLTVEEPYPDFGFPPNEGILDTQTRGEDGFPLIFDDVLSRPTVRGHGGQFRFEDCWLNTGSGVQKGLIEKWKVDGKVPQDWMKQLGENFLEEFVGKTWNWYNCSVCASEI